MPICRLLQVEGIRFMFDNIVERVSEFERSQGFGCILAHAMGLGKTLQVISFVDIFLRHTPAKKVLCIVPINALQNWMTEFDKWVPSEFSAHSSPSGAKSSASSSQASSNPMSAASSPADSPSSASTKTESSKMLTYLQCLSIGFLPRG